MESGDSGRAGGYTRKTHHVFRELEPEPHTTSDPSWGQGDRLEMGIDSPANEIPIKRWTPEPG